MAHEDLKQKLRHMKIYLVPTLYFTYMHGCQYILHDGLVVTVSDAEGPTPTLVEARINTVYIVNSSSPDIK